MSSTLAEVRQLIADLSLPVDEQPADMAIVGCNGQVRHAEIADAKQLFADDPSKVLTHDAKFRFKQVAPTQTPVRFDVSLAGYVLWPGRTSYRLADMAQG